jgi:hydroxybutyrate-dimer hydrolase
MADSAAAASPTPTDRPDRLKAMRRKGSAKQSTVFCRSAQLRHTRCILLSPVTPDTASRQEDMRGKRMLRMRVGSKALAFGLLASTALAPGLLAGTASAQNTLPSFVLPQTLSFTDYDGVSDDLLTAGLGVTGLSSAVAPAVANPLSPTVAELRRRAIHNAYRGLVDTSTGGGWRVLYGPNLDANYNDTGTEGKVAGREYIALTDDGSGSNYQTMIVQIPTNANQTQPCMVTGPSSGSRNVYGAIGTAGEWAFRNGCVAVYTDKGTGNFFHDVTRDYLYDRFGQFLPRGSVGSATNFAASFTTNLNAFAAAYPNRLAYKQAHSGKLVDGKWGDYTLQAIEFGFYAMNQYLAAGAARFTSTNTTVISSGVSNGGGAAVMAAEKDAKGLIDGVVAVIPNVIPPQRSGLSIRYGANTLTAPGKHFIDYYTQIALYAPCAALDSSLTGATLNADPSGSPSGSRANRCAALKGKGLLSSTTLAAQAAESLQLIHNYGYMTEGDWEIPLMENLNAYRQIIDTYVAEYGRFHADDALCGTTFAATNTAGAPIQLPAATAALLFAAGNIIPPSGGVNVIAENAANGPINEVMAVSRSTGLADLNLDAALCYRSLVTGEAAPGTKMSMRDKINSTRVRQGMQEVVGTANLRGLPSLIIQARNDEVIHPNHAGRAYFGWNKIVEGSASKLSYIEVPNTQHFESLIGLFGPTAAPIYLPIHHYFVRGLDAMLANLRTGAALPQSQVMRTVSPRSAALTAANYKSFLPDMETTPSAANAISVSNNTVVIPQ